MSGPGNQILTKPEEAIRRPADLDDSILLGLKVLQERIQCGDLDTITIADTLNTFASIIRQIISGDDDAGSYLEAPLTNLKQLAYDMAQIGTDTWVCTVPVLRGTPLATSSSTPGQLVPFTALMGPEYSYVGFSNDETLLAEQMIRVCRPGATTKSLTGLIPSVEYFIQEDGSISPHHPGPNATRVQSLGVAKASNELYVVYRDPIFRKNSFL